MRHELCVWLAAAVAVVVTGCDDTDPCLSQCELAAAECVERPMEDFPDLAEVRADWLEMSGTAACDGRFPLAREGTCGDGTRFVTVSSGFVTETSFFTADGVFVGLSHSTDVVDEICQGNGYWPEPQSCETPQVDAILCGRL